MRTVILVLLLCPLCYSQSATTFDIERAKVGAAASMLFQSPQQAQEIQYQQFEKSVLKNIPAQGKVKCHVDHDGKITFQQAEEPEDTQVVNNNAEVDKKLDRLEDSILRLTDRLQDLQSEIIKLTPAPKAPEPEPEVKQTPALPPQTKREEKSAPLDGTAQVPTIGSLEQGKLFSQAFQRPAIIHFFKETGCEACIKMDKQVFSDSGVAKLLRDNFVYVRINGDKAKPEVLDQWSIKGFPQDIVVPMDWTRGRQLVPTLDAEEYKSMLVKSIDWVAAGAPLKREMKQVPAQELTFRKPATIKKPHYNTMNNYGDVNVIVQQQPQQQVYAQAPVTTRVTRTTTVWSTAPVQYYSAPVYAAPPITYYQAPPVVRQYYAAPVYAAPVYAQPYPQTIIIAPQEKRGLLRRW